MASTETIDALLSAAAALLDRAAGEIRDAGLSPVDGNVIRVGRALAEVFEIQAAIYTMRPDLAPPELSQASPHADANRRLSRVMCEAFDLEQAGSRDRAISTYRDYLALEESLHHLDIARGEIKRLEGLAPAA